jgi:hypothetical protein
MPSVGPNDHPFLVFTSFRTTLRVLALGLALASCAGDSAPSTEDAGTERNTATAPDSDEGDANAQDDEDAEPGESDAGSDGPAPAAEDAGSAAQDASIATQDAGTALQDAGSAARDASAQDAAAPADAGPDAPPSVDLSGTWITKIETLATETVPLVGEIDVQLEFSIRFAVTHTAGKLRADFEICALSTETQPEPELLIVSFPPALIATLRTSVNADLPALRTGDVVPLPALTIRSGFGAGTQPADSDADSHPGVTVPANLGGILPIEVYTGLTVQASITGRLTTANEITGSATFSVTGSVFGSDTPLLSEGTLSVAPKSGAVPLTVKRLAGDVPCSEVLNRLR